MSITAVMNGSDITISSPQLSSPWTIERVQADPLTGEYDRINGLMSKHLQLALAAGENLKVALDDVKQAAEDLNFLKDEYDAIGPSTIWAPGSGLTSAYSATKERLILAGVVFPWAMTRGAASSSEQTIYATFKDPETAMYAGVELGSGAALLGGGYPIPTVAKTIAQAGADLAASGNEVVYKSSDGVLFVVHVNSAGTRVLSELNMAVPWFRSDRTATAAEMAQIKDSIRSAADKSTLTSLDLQNTIQKLVSTKSTNELAVTELIKLRRRNAESISRNI